MFKMSAFTAASTQTTSPLPLINGVIHSSALFQSTPHARSRQ